MFKQIKYVFKVDDEIIQDYLINCKFEIKGCNPNDQ